MKTGYSQNDEEECILASFADAAPARFLDIGAHDGESCSNTRALSESGWGGTLVEPSASAFRPLMDLYRGRNDINLVNVAIAPPGREGLMKFHDSRGDMISTVDEAHLQRWSAAGGQFQPIHVAAVTTAALLAAFPGPYAFVNLDVEGINYELFLTLPLRTLECRLVCVEYQDKLVEIEAHAAQQGYFRRHVTSENAIFAAR